MHCVPGLGTHVFAELRVVSSLVVGSSLPSRYAMPFDYARMSRYDPAVRLTWWGHHVNGS
jgi:hypothetical protein